MDSVITLALHDAVTAQPWLATLVIQMANYGVFLLPAALIGAWLYAGTTQAERRRAAASMRLNDEGGSEPFPSAWY